MLITFLLRGERHRRLRIASRRKPSNRRPVVHVHQPLQLPRRRGGRPLLSVCPRTRVDPAAPPVVAVHGISRRAEQHLAAFVHESERSGRMLVAPLFTKGQLPAVPEGNPRRLSGRSGAPRHVKRGGGRQPASTRQSFRPIRFFRRRPVCSSFRVAPSGAHRAARPGIGRLVHAAEPSRSPILTAWRRHAGGCRAASDPTSRLSSRSLPWCWSASGTPSATPRCATDSSNRPTPGTNPGGARGPLEPGIAPRGGAGPCACRRPVSGAARLRPLLRSLRPRRRFGPGGYRLARAVVSRKRLSAGRIIELRINSPSRAAFRSLWPP